MSDRGSDGRFLPANRVAKKHGLHSPGEMGAAVGRVRPEVERSLASSPDDPERYRIATRSLEQRIAVCDQLAGYLDRAGVFDGRGRVRPVVGQLVKAWASLDSALRASALTPQSAAALAKTAGDAQGQLDRLREKGAGDQGLEVEADGGE